MTGIVEMLLVYGVLLKSTLEDIQTLTISREWLFGGWGLLALWQLGHGQVWPVVWLLAMLAWGLGYGPSWPVVLFLPAIPYWPVLLVGAGVREGLIGDGDLLALSLAALYSPLAGWLGFIGLLAWSVYSRKAGSPWAPALPGLLLGVVIFWFVGG